MSELQESFFRDDDENRNSDIHFGLQVVKIQNIRLFVHKKCEDHGEWSSYRWYVEQVTTGKNEKFPVQISDEGNCDQDL